MTARALAAHVLIRPIQSVSRFAIRPLISKSKRSLAIAGAGALLVYFIRERQFRAVREAPFPDITREGWRDRFCRFIGDIGTSFIRQRDGWPRKLDREQQLRLGVVPIRHAYYCPNLSCAVRFTTKQDGPCPDCGGPIANLGDSLLFKTPHLVEKFRCFFVCLDCSLLILQDVSGATCPACKSAAWLFPLCAKVATAQLD